MFNQNMGNKKVMKKSYHKATKKCLKVMEKSSPITEELVAPIKNFLENHRQDSSV